MKEYSSGAETGRIYCIIVSKYANSENAVNASEKYDNMGCRTNRITAPLTAGKKTPMVPVTMFSKYYYAE